MYTLEKSSSSGTSDDIMPIAKLFSRDNFEGALALTNIIYLDEQQQLTMNESTPIPIIIKVFAIITSFYLIVLQNDILKSFKPMPSSKCRKVQERSPLFHSIVHYTKMAILAVFVIIELENDLVNFI
ncbi:21699_t:CDS:2 [Entrophospora sp. SA101]|nr:21699_t:CDS:2 [Entrophospora sp. SA101]